MAGIDKLYLENWYAFDRLVRWSICHYPELLNKKMFDYRGLIPKGLAEIAPEGMYNT